MIRELARRGKSRLFVRLAEEAQLLDSSRVFVRVRDIFCDAFDVLKIQGCRDEYVYKTALVRKILLGRHSFQTASMLNEFRVGECKADLVILNGTATVYEVKSERDSLSRLERQLTAYSRVFPRVYVIAAESHVGSILKSVPQEVGVLGLSSRLQIKTMRQAIDCHERVSPNAIFDSIRTDEARMILQALKISVQSVPNTQINAVLRDCFAKISPEEALQGMLWVLKKTRSLMYLSELTEQLPSCLQTAALSVPMRKLDHARLVSAINVPINAAIAWT